MTNSRQKGARGEREWRDQLRAAGYTARRGQQFAGGTESPDVICDELASVIHWEVKRVESLNIHSAVAQAMRDAGGKAPMVAHRRNAQPWLVTMTAEALFGLLRDGIDGLKNKQ
jgi:Holliday junction resolvase